MFKKTYSIIKTINLGTVEKAWYKKKDDKWHVVAGGCTVQKVIKISEI